jgi:hypothetical protein
MIRSLWQFPLLLLSFVSQRIYFTTKTPTFESGSASSTRSHGKYMKYGSFPWPSVVAARDR